MALRLMQDQNTVHRRVRAAVRWTTSLEARARGRSQSLARSIPHAARYSAWGVSAGGSDPGGERPRRRNDEEERRAEGL